jgi:hypothetical protein
MSQTQRNTILRQLDNEYTTFLKEEINISQFSYLHMKHPEGKDLKETKIQGKKLISLIKLYGQLKTIEINKKMLEKIIEVNRHCHNEDNTSQIEWSKQHEKQLKLGMKYLKDKKAYVKLYN